MAKSTEEIKVHPLVKEMITKAKKIGLSMRDISKKAHVSRDSINKWTEKGVMPRKTSLEKIKAFIQRMDSGKITDSKTPTKQPPRQIIQDDWPEERKEFYRMIYKVENKNGKVSNAPDTDKDLYELHNFLGVKPLLFNKDGSIKYCRIELEKLRKEHNLHYKDMSVIAGKSLGWYNNFMSGRDFEEELAMKFADYFEIPVEDLLNSEYKKEVLADAED